MSHLDSERLVLLALADGAPEPAEDAHLAGCPDCRAELTACRAVAELGRRTEDLRDLPAPAPAVWEAIAARAFAPATGAADTASRWSADEAVPRPAVTSAARPAVSTPSSPPAVAGVAVPRRVGRSDRSAPRRAPGPRQFARKPSRFRLALVAAAAVVLGAVGTGGATWLAQRDGARVVAQADLAPQPAAPPGAGGTVQIVDSGHGLQMRVTLTGMPAPAGYYAVWLYDGGTVMVPVGSPGSAPLNIPETATNLNRFDIVDVSVQSLGQQQHGTSMLQGVLHH